MEQRQLQGQAAKAALETITNREHCVLRYVDMVISYGALYMYYHTKSVDYLALDNDLLALSAEAIRMTMDSSISDTFLELMHLKREELKKTHTCFSCTIHKAIVPPPAAT